MNRVEHKIATGLIGLASLFGMAGCATFPSPATREVKTGDVIRREDVSLCKRDIVQLRQPNPFGVRAVNFNYILRTGSIPMSDFGFYNDSIDWTKDDAFTRALKAIEAKAREKIGASAALQALLKKDAWSRDDRALWEKEASNIIGAEVWAVPGLDAYRTHDKILGHALNALSRDIERHSKDCEFDCKGMSFIRGCLLQKIENSLLPVSAPPRDFRRAMDYFVIAGGVCFSDENKTGGHTFIFTPAGNIIESTRKAGRDDYKTSATPHSFEAFVRGRPFVSTENDVYGGYWTDHEAARAAAKTAPRESDKIFTREEVLGSGHARCDGDFVMVSSCAARDGKTEYGLALYQKRNAGSPLEGYVEVGHECKTVAPGERAPVLKGRYHDALSGRDYRFSHDYMHEGSHPELTTQDTGQGFYYYAGEFSPSAPAL
jgi:hypothetical protein